MHRVISEGTLNRACQCALKRIEQDHDFKAQSTGEKGTLDFRVFFSNHEDTMVSPWHSIPLYTEHGMLNYVCEIPRNTRAKFEVSTTEEGNPIKQDSKKGKPRSYGIDMKWNYGMFPQTWEDPAHASEDCGGFVGDNDPVDVVDVGNVDGVTGGVYAVKPIAALAMIDEGELDWKVVCINTADPRHKLVNDVQDMETYFPGTLSEVREWFRTYKTHEGKPLNKFELNEVFVNQSYTLDVISQTHEFWKSMVSQAKVDPSLVKVVVGNVPVITGCFEPDVMDATTEALADTIHSVLEAVHKHEEEEHVHEHPVDIAAQPRVFADLTAVEEDEQEVNRTTIQVLS